MLLIIQNLCCIRDRQKIIRSNNKVRNTAVSVYPDIRAALTRSIETKERGKRTKKLNFAKISTIGRLHKCPLFICPKEKTFEIHLFHYGRKQGIKCHILYRNIQVETLYRPIFIGFPHQSYSCERITLFYWVWVLRVGVGVWVGVGVILYVIKMKFDANFPYLVLLQKKFYSTMPARRYKNIWFA